METPTYPAYTNSNFQFKYKLLQNIIQTKRNQKKNDTANHLSINTIPSPTHRHFNLLYYKPRTYRNIQKFYSKTKFDASRAHHFYSILNLQLPLEKKNNSIFF